MKTLVDQNGNAAVIGKIYWDFRHEEQYRLDRIDAPHKPSSTGRVQCTNIATGSAREFFPGVLNLEWKDTQERPIPDYVGWTMLFKLDNGNYMRICNLLDDPEYEYGYDYFDGATKKIIDGGCFDLESASSADDILKSALDWSDLNPYKTGYEFVTDEAEYSDLEEMGFTGF